MKSKTYFINDTQETQANFTETPNSFVLEFNKESGISYALESNRENFLGLAKFIQEYFQTQQ